MGPHSVRALCRMFEREKKKQEDKISANATFFQQSSDPPAQLGEDGQLLCVSGA